MNKTFALISGSVVQVLAEQEAVVGPGEVPYELGLAVEAQGAEAAGEGVVGRGYHTPVHRAQVLEQVGLLLEHSHAQPAGEGLLAGVHPQVGLQVPGHTELLAAVGAPVLPNRGGFGRIFGCGRRRCPGGGQGPRAPRGVQTWGCHRVRRRRTVDQYGRGHRSVL